jgi:hypothetical protein
MATPPEIQETRNISGAQMALAGGGVVLLLVVLWFVFLRGGDDDPLLETAPTTPPLTEPVEPVEPVDPGKGGRGKGPVETFEVFAPKDPFRPLVSAVTDTGTAAADPAAPVVDTNGDGVVDGKDDPGTGNGTGTGTGNGTGTGGGENVGGHRVLLVDVYRSGGGARAQVQVDGTVYTVEEGERFADNFQLVSISGECATMLFGDDQFTLCEGEEILK